MSNTIQIKRGAGKPDGKLAPYELGYDVEDGYLYIGGALEVDDPEQGTMKYGATQGIKVEFAINATYATNAINAINADYADAAGRADFAEEATKAGYADEAVILIDDSHNPYTAGGAGIPVWLENGILKPCNNEGGIVNLTVQSAKSAESATKAISAGKWEKSIKLSTSLDSEISAEVDGAADAALGVTGTLPIGHGGTGATTATGARSNLGAASSAVQVYSGSLGSGSTTLTNIPTDASVFIVIGNTVSGYAKVSCIIPANLADGNQKFQLYSDGYYISFALSKTDAKITISQRNSTGVITDIYCM